jgi:hypothetical protein
MIWLVSRELLDRWSPQTENPWYLSSHIFCIAGNKCHLKVLIHLCTTIMGIDTAVPKIQAKSF